MGSEYASYIRRSTAEQEEQHQRESIHRWLQDQDLSLGDIDVYAEQASGASADRGEFQELIENIEAGEYTDVVVWEISRIARKGFLAQKFFDVCEQNGVTIHVTDGSVRRIEPDGTGRMVADVIAAVAAQERRDLIRRTRAGLARAQDEGVWTGQVPVGFVRVETGGIRPNLQPDYDAGETGYHDVIDALERIEADEWSYRKAAQNTPNVTRQTLSNIHDERVEWYLDGPDSIDDDRVASAVATIEQ
jgi:DNA invertase Pin-like site-specific DNA recombinase